MKTITELNSKWWYRLVKVIFIGFILLCVVVSILITLDDNKPKQVEDYKIDCVADYSNKKTFLAEKDADIYIFWSRSDTIYQSLSDDTKQKIRKICDISEEEKQNADKKAIAYINEQIKSGASHEAIQNYLDANLRAYVISETEVTKGSYPIVIGVSLLSIIIILVIAEVIRRVFYYIILGKVRPEK